MRISSGECTRSCAGLVLVMPSIRTSKFELQLSSSVNGRVTHEKNISGAATQRLVPSG